MQVVKPVIVILDDLSIGFSFFEILHKSIIVLLELLVDPDPLSGREEPARCAKQRFNP